MANKFWWVNEESLKVLNSGYLQKGDTVESRVRHVAKTAASILKRPDLEQGFYDIVANGWMSLSSPIWANFGNDRGMPISCFSSYISDDIVHILDTLKDVGVMTKVGGGTAADFSALRAKGAPISKGGESSGVISFIEPFDSVVGSISQGSCYIEGTKVLTNKGFKDFREVVHGVDMLAEVDEYNNLSFTSNYELVKTPYKGEVISISGKKRDSLIDISVTPNHRMVVERAKGCKRSGTHRWAGYTEIVEAENLRLHRSNRMHMTSVTNTVSKPLSFEERFMIAFQADGRKSKPTHKVSFRFAKERKKERMEYLCNNLGFKYTRRDVPNSNVTEFYIEDALHLKKEDFSWIDLATVSKEWCLSFLDEVAKWDGSLYEKTGRIKYSSIDKSCVDMIQAIASICGKRTRVSHRDRSASGRRMLYSVEISNQTNKLSGESCVINRTQYKGDVYCAIVPKGRLLVSYNDRTLVCGNTRRGAFAAYLDINHPEILDFIKIKDKGNRMQNINTSVVVDDVFMNGMLNKEPEKLKVWAAVLKSRKEKGIPYIFFKDNVNNNKPQAYKDKGLTIHHSNLCVSGDTKLLTDKGEVPIKDLAGTYANLWNGEDFSRSFVFKTSDAAKLLRVSVENEFGDTHYLNCTEYHRFYDIDGVEYRANELTEGLVLELVNYKGYKTTLRVVKSIVNVEGVHETFCAFEPVRNRITVNGILTGNCSEIKLHTNEDESLVCCLSSMNLELYDEWKDTNAVELAIYFLDAVMQEFIDKSEGVAGLERAHRFAKRQRALGLGVLGWHSYLQKNMIPFESIEAAIRNEEIFKDIYEKSQSATAKLAKEYGEPELLKSYGVRNVTTIAVAPTTSSSSILGQVSPGIEPYKSNHYTAALAKGSFERLNKHLVTLLKSKEGVDVNATIMSIMKNLGSVQHLSCLTNEEKAVFRTFAEIDPNSIIEQAAVRQKYIDQGQSLNLHIGNKYTPKDVNELVIKAWKLGIKSLYYQRGESESKTKLSELSCINCEA